MRFIITSNMDENKLMVTGTLAICQEKEGLHSRSVVWVVSPTVEACTNHLSPVPRTSVFLPLGSSHSMFGAEGGLLRKRETSDLNVLINREDWIK